MSTMPTSHRWATSGPRSGFRGARAGCSNARIPGIDRTDAIGPYPIFSCTDWSALDEDLSRLEGDPVSIVLVADPLGTTRSPPAPEGVPDRASPSSDTSSAISGLRRSCPPTIGAGCADATFNRIATLARQRGLDFVNLSDHNTSSHLALAAEAQQTLTRRPVPARRRDHDVRRPWQRRRPVTYVDHRDRLHGPHD